MNQTLRTVLVLSASLLCFLLYCHMWIDWVQDLNAGVYIHHQLEAIIETAALAVYTYLAIRFAFNRLHLF